MSSELTYAHRPDARPPEPPPQTRHKPAPLTRGIEAPPKTTVRGTNWAEKLIGGGSRNCFWPLSAHLAGERGVRAGFGVAGCGQSQSLRGGGQIFAHGMHGSREPERLISPRPPTHRLPSTPSPQAAPIPILSTGYPQGHRLTLSRVLCPPPTSSYVLCPTPTRPPPCTIDPHLPLSMCPQPPPNPHHVPSVIRCVTG